MNFDKANYLKSKKEVECLIKTSHDWKNTEGFILDGIISPDIYEQQKLKTLVILGESYGYDECGMMEIEDQPETDLIGIKAPKVQAPRKISSLMWLLHHSIYNGIKTQWDDFPELFRLNQENIKQLQESLSKIAWINVKKASKNIDKWGSGVTRQSDHEIYTNAFRNKEIISKQITSIAPDLIIVCSTPVFNSLNEMELLGKGIVNRKYEVQSNNNGQKIIYVSHPSYYRHWGYERIYETFELIYETIK